MNASDRPVAASDIAPEIAPEIAAPDIVVPFPAGRRIGFPDRVERAALRRPYAALLLFCLLLWLPGFFTIPPSDRDESRFAQATKQMIETGDFVRIRNGEEARNRKPIGIYWAQLPFAAAARAAGVAQANPIWPYRIPSFLGALLAVCATFGLGQALVGRRAAFLAAAMLGGSVLLTVEAHIAKTDAALTGVTTLAMLLLARARTAPRFGAAPAALFWLAMGAGILLKGPITPMVAGLAVLLLGVWERRWDWLRRLRAGWGVPLMLATVLPWFVAIGIETHGRFFAQAVGGDLGRKLAGGDDAHGAPPGFHLLLLPLLAFPATIPVIRAFPAAWAQVRRRATDPATRFLVAWAVPSWLVMEAVPTKLPHYTLPLYPALFLLVAHVLARPATKGVPAPARGTARRWPGRLAAGLFALAAALLGLGFAALPLALGAAWLWALPPLLAAALIAVPVLRSGDMRWGLLAAPLLYWAVLQGVLPHTQALWIAPRLAAALEAHWPQGRPAGGGFGAVGFHEPSLMFLAGTGTDWLDSAAAGADFLAHGPDRVVAVDTRDEAAFDREAARDGVVPRPFATVRGFNYSRGRWIALTLYARAARDGR